MDTFAATRCLTRFCARHWFLHRCLDPLYRHAEARGYKTLVRENALRLLEQAHVERLTGREEEAAARAGRAMDHFESLASRGDAAAAYHLAEAHRTGFGRTRNHWKALEHYTLAVNLGHPEAQARVRQLQDREPVEDDTHEAFGRQALLKATYTQARSERHARSLQAWLRAAIQDGLGLRNALIMLGLAGLLAGYLVVDIYFFGMGAWRPDPTRVVWGLFGKIHPPKDDSVSRVLPGWLRPDARSVSFTFYDLSREAGGRNRIGDFEGQVVYLYVVDGPHPAVFESVPFLKALNKQQDASLKFFMLYQPARENAAAANSFAQMALEFPPCFPEGERSFRPLGKLRTFPMNFVIDRHGRIRQQWSGFSEAITREAIKGALAES